MMKSPLYDLEAAQGAQFGQYHSWEVAEHYGDALREC